MGFSSKLSEAIRCKKCSRRRRGTRVQSGYDACPMTGNTEGMCPVTLLQRQAFAMGKKETGNDLFRTGDFDGALKMYTEACKMDPNKGVYFLNRSKACMKLGNQQEAVEDAKKAVELDSGNVKVWWQYIQCLHTMQRKDDSLMALENAWENLDKSEEDNFALLQLDRSVRGLALMPNPTPKDAVKRQKQTAKFAQAIGGNSARKTTEPALPPKNEALERKKRVKIEECVSARLEMRKKALALLEKGAPPKGARADADEKRRAREELDRREQRRQAKLGKENEASETVDVSETIHNSSAKCDDSAEPIGASTAKSDVSAKPVGAPAGKSDDSAEPTGASTAKSDDSAEPIGASTAKRDDSAEPVGAPAAKSDDSAEPIGASTAKSDDSAEPIGASTAKSDAATELGTIPNANNGTTVKTKHEAAYKQYNSQQNDDLTIQGGHKYLARPKNVELPDTYQEPLGSISADEMFARGNCNCDRLLLSVFGDIFDVSDRPDKYGKKGIYWELAGKDITYGLSIGNDSPEIANRFYDLYKAEDPSKELIGITGWLYHFEREYGSSVGRMEEYRDEGYHLPAPPLEDEEKGECVIQ